MSCCEAGAQTEATQISNVQDFGATPNDRQGGSADIQTAIDAAPNNSTIYLPEGTHESHRQYMRLVVATMNRETKGIREQESTPGDQATWEGGGVGSGAGWRSGRRRPRNTRRARWPVRAL